MKVDAPHSRDKERINGRINVNGLPVNAPYVLLILEYYILLLL